MTLDNYRLKGIKMIVFKRATNPCLIGRDVLSVHPSTQDHFLAMMGLKKPKAPTTLPINQNDEREGFTMECKDHEKKNRAPYKTKIENAVERKCLTKSTIESFYDCDRDHDCALDHYHQFNSIEGPITPATSPTEIILIRALHILLEETNQALDESITEHEQSNTNQVNTFAIPSTPTSRQPIVRSGLTSALRDKLTLDLTKKKIHRTKSPSGRRLNLSQSSTSSAHNDLTSLRIEEAEPEHEFNYSESTQEARISTALNTSESMLNDSEIKQEPGTRRDPQGELLEDEPYSNNTELGTRRDPQGELMEEPDSSQDDQVYRLNLSSIKNLGLINERWTEILEEKAEGRAHERDDVRKEIFDMLRRNQSKPITEIVDECIRINPRTYAPVEVNKDRNGRTLYAPILPNAKLDISFGAETRSLNTSDSEDKRSKPIEDELIEAEYPRVQRQQPSTTPNIKVNFDVEIIKPKLRDNRMGKKTYQFFKSCLTKDELIKTNNI